MSQQSGRNTVIHPRPANWADSFVVIAVTESSGLFPSSSDSTFLLPLTLPVHLFSLSVLSQSSLSVSLSSACWCFPGSDLHVSQIRLSYSVISSVGKPNPWYGNVAHLEESWAIKGCTEMIFFHFFPSSLLLFCSWWMTPWPTHCHSWLLHFPAYLWLPSPANSTWNICISTLPYLLAFVSHL